MGVRSVRRRADRGALLDALVRFAVGRRAASFIARRFRTEASVQLSSLRSLAARAWHLRSSKPAQIVIALVPGVAVLVAVSSLGWFDVRTTPPPPPAPQSPSPWTLSAADAVDDGACQLSLTVRDAVAGGGVVDGARLSIVRLAAGEVVERVEARTDRKGSYRAIDLAPGTWNVTVDVDGRALQGTPDFACDARGKRAHFDLAAQDGAHVVAGRVVDDQRQPLPRAQVALWQADVQRTGLAGVVRVDVDASGRFRAALPAGEYVTWTSAPEHVARRGSLRVTQPQTAWTTRLAFRPAVRGVVVDETGTAMAGAVVSMGEAWDPTASVARVVADASGRFEMPVAQGQELTLTARGEGRLGRLLVGVVDDVRGLQALTLVARPGRTVGGVVVDDSGAPRPFGRVHFRVRALGLEGEVACDAQGRFVLDGMPQDDVEAWAADTAIGAWGARVADASTSQLSLPWAPPSY